MQLEIMRNMADRRESGIFMENWFLFGVWNVNLWRVRIGKADSTRHSGVLPTAKAAQRLSVCARAHSTRLHQIPYSIERANEQNSHGMRLMHVILDITNDMLKTGRISTLRDRFFLCM